MLANSLQYKARPAKFVNVLSPYLKHLNMGTLALILAIGLAIVTNMRGKSPDVRKSPSGRVSDSQVASCASK